MAVANPIIKNFIIKISRRKVPVEPTIKLDVGDVKYQSASPQASKPMPSVEKIVVSTGLIVIIKAYIWEIRDVGRGCRGILPC
jgi:hypothetical protein